MHIQTRPHPLTLPTATNRPAEEPADDPFLDQMAPSAAERRDAIIDEFASVVATGFWGCLGAGLGGGAASLASGGNPVAGFAGALAGAAALGTLSAKGYNEAMGKTMVAAGSVGLGTLLGFLAGNTTGAVIGGSLGAAYAGYGLYATWGE